MPHWIFFQAQDFFPSGGIVFLTLNGKDIIPFTGNNNFAETPADASAL